jgi:hypothetical protein
MKTETKQVYRGGCPSCPGTEDVLTMDTVLYNGFGGYQVQCDEEVFYCGDINGEYDSFKTLKEIEKAAKKNPEKKWKVILSNPLRGATWERQKDGHWILTETNMGFA